MIEINHLVKKYGSHVAVDDLVKSMVFWARTEPENQQR